MRILHFLPLLFLAFHTKAQGFSGLFSDCQVTGSTTVFDLKHNKWFFTNKSDADSATLPASTFKIINLLIALETKAIKDENEIVKWQGQTDTVLYGYRPEIYRDMTVKEAFEVSAGWVFMELSERIGRKAYARYLTLCGYGNGDLSKPGADFWNYGPFAISPKNQVAFLAKLYEGNIPFSKKNINIVKRVMVTGSTASHTLRSKTGWTRVNGKDIGWWVGYVERGGHTYFFATRISKKRPVANPGFAQCRKSITLNILRELKMLD